MCITSPQTEYFAVGKRKPHPPPKKQCIHEDILDWFKEFADEEFSDESSKHTQLNTRKVQNVKHDFQSTVFRATFGGSRFHFKQVVEEKLSRQKRLSWFKDATQLAKGKRIRKNAK